MCHLVQGLASYNLVKDKNNIQLFFHRKLPVFWRNNGTHLQSYKMPLSTEQQYEYIARLRTGCQGDCLGLKRSVTGGWEKLHYERLHNFYCSLQYYNGDQISRTQLANQITYMGEE